MTPAPSRPSQWFEACVFDLDGTLYLGESLLPGAAETVARLRDRDIPVRFLSNNPTSTPEAVAARLSRLGLPADVSEVTNPLVTTVAWLREHAPDAVVLAIGEQPLQDALSDAGFELSDDAARIDVVLASYDRTFDYRKLQVAFDALWFHRRAILVQTNPDRFCPLPGGRGEPDCAAIVAAIEACTGVRCQANLGKPDPIMLRTALRGIDADPARVLVVGDRLHTDIRMAADAGMASALVLTGDSQASEVDDVAPEHRPTFVLDGVGGIIPR